MCERHVLAACYVQRFGSHPGPSTAAVQLGCTVAQFHSAPAFGRAGQLCREIPCTSLVARVVKPRRAEQTAASATGASSHEVGSTHCA